MLALLCIFLGGCGKNAEKKPPQNTQEQGSVQKPKEPDQLKDITKEIEGIFLEAKKKSEMQEKPSQGQKSSQTESGGGGNKQQGSQTGSGKESQKSKTEDWAKEEKSIKNIHKKWNSLEVDIVKAGAADSLIQEFEINLDNLTNQVMARSIMGTQKAANELYGSIVKIAALYQTDNPPPADMLKYFTQKSLLAIEEYNWAEAASNNQNLKKQWEKVKTLMGKEGARLNTQMDYAISDFGQSIGKKNKDVAKIKGEILLSNIEKIIKELKKNQNM
ncbi:MAG: hypothetical protein ACOX4H_06830 [Bacillota bacterium]|nr:hypothetical protein [Clostridia bacterium]